MRTMRLEIRPLAMCGEGLNDDSPTRFPSNGSPSSPDISLVSSHLALSTTWCTRISLNSDHLPICISFEDDQPPPRQTQSYINYERAKWGLYTSETERLISCLGQPSSCSKGVSLFNKALLTASKHHIPVGYREDFVPGFPREAVDLAKERDRRCEADPQDPEVSRLNEAISEVVSNEQKKA
jgi:hypothetical protein